ncbi:28S ribosomal protein S15, mitochondrial [Nylanderia fulva]|uniref:28S ribosomal protein S15, mitochondrial n=1 Tax=Nylanderia fulva TaxID=613905 RepID=UPI0010FB4C42|nr:28S ribosomal protein S15, mitochondrial [Nylanderia fulva]
MNIIINNCRQTVRNLLRNADNLSRRYATTVADYKITWTRPEEVSPLSPERSGDKGLKIDVSSKDLIQEYAESPEMKDASDLVKKMFTLQFQQRTKTTSIKIKKYLDLVNRHEFDDFSPEATIAVYTCKIHDLQEFIKVYPRDAKAKVALKEAIEKRRKWLKDLRNWDYRRFEWILEKLNLVYIPYPDPPNRITRKESLTRLTEKHCDKLVQDKLNAYKKELKAAQANFYVEKAEKLAFIRKEELSCGLQPSVSEEDIAKAKEKAKEYQT